MKPSPKAIVATLVATALALATAALVHTPSAALAQDLPHSTPIPAQATPHVLPPDHILSLLGMVAPPPAPTMTPRLIPLPVPRQPLTLPILYMHRVQSVPSDIASWSASAQQVFVKQSIPACAFTAQLAWLRANAYHTVLPRDVIAFWDEGTPLPANPIILTFDDGWPDWYSTVFPLLQANGFTAEFYVSLDNIGSSITWDQLREMAAAGMGIGAHDVNHFQLTGGPVTPASPEVMRYQVTEAKRVLESQLGIPVDSMAYVGGGYDATLMGIVQAAGYSSARAVNRGTWQEPGARYRLRVSRLGFWDDIVSGTFESAVNCDLDPALPTFESRVLGTNPG